MLASLLSSGVHHALPLIVNVPGWHQYVNLIEQALDFLAKLLHNAGLAVIVFTILIKTVLVPLTVQSLRSSKAMQELQPKIKELQKKYGKDRQRLSQETMRLYSEHRVNPMSGCLPMVIQIPIFFGLYRAILNLSKGTGIENASDYWHGSFLWLQSLAAHDPYHILPILAALFQFIQTKMMRPANQGKIADPQQAMMNQMMTFMPLMVVVFGWGFAAGPVIYWVTQSVFSVIQQWFITGWGSMHDWMPALPELPEHRRLGYRPPRDLDDVVVVSGDDDGAPPRPSGVMGWMQRRMEEAERRTPGRAGASSGRTGAPATTGGYQARVDDETGPPARRPAGSGRRGAKRGARAASGTASTAASGASSGANGATTSVETVANGRVARGPVVPRKSRPARKHVDSGASE